MAKMVVLVGSLDTKGKEFAFIKELIEKEGLETLVWRRSGLSLIG